jgi:hypothetical protein
MTPRPLSALAAVRGQRQDLFSETPAFLVGKTLFLRTSKIGPLPGQFEPRVGYEPTSLRLTDSHPYKR